VLDPRAYVHADPTDVVTANLALAGVQPGTHLDAERLHRVAIAMTQRIARCGPSNIARKPSPDVFTSRPRKRASCDRTTASFASSNACQSRSPISGGSPRRVTRI
jgi:hypothetical protein